MPDLATLRDHLIQTSKDGRLDDFSTRGHVTDVVTRAVASTRPIVIHLHGGLVKKGSAYATAEHLLPSYDAAGLYPIFIVWRTGLDDAFKNLNEVASKPVFQKLLVRLLKFFVAKLGPAGKGIASPGIAPDDAEVEEELAKLEEDRTPFADVTLDLDDGDLQTFETTFLEREVQTDRALNAAFDHEVDLAMAETPVTAEEEPAARLDRDIAVEARMEDETLGKGLFSGTLVVHAVKIAARVTRRFYRKTDHRLYATIVEEICRELFLDAVGTAVWGFMKQDAADTFQNVGQEPARGGWLLLQLLDEQFRRLRADGQPLPSLSIVGHSAGSIYASNLLLYLAAGRGRPGAPLHQTPVTIDRLVFLAPACRHDLFAEVLREHARQPLFRRFRLYSLTDEHELGYFEVPGVYPASLLYLVSGLFEDEEGDGNSDQPIVGMLRYYRERHPYRQPEVITVGDFLRRQPDLLVVSGEDRGDGLRCDSYRHGAFDDTPATIGSFIHFIHH
jgi:hypothetical protein